MLCAPCAVKESSCLHHISCFAYYECLSALMSASSSQSRFIFVYFCALYSSLHYILRLPLWYSAYAYIYIVFILVFWPKLLLIQSANLIYFPCRTRTQIALETDGSFNISYCSATLIQHSPSWQGSAGLPRFCGTRKLIAVATAVYSEPD
jgi:hypothetical protein